MRTKLLLAALLIFTLGGTAAHTAACRDISLRTERAKLQRILSSNGFSSGEQAFLSKGAAQRVRELQQSQLNTRGAACGIDAVRAQVLGCLNQMLPSPLASLTSPESKTGKALWGKANVSAREALVIGMFHTCRGAAMQALLK